MLCQCNNISEIILSSVGIIVMIDVLYIVIKYYILKKW
jgi:hypothetical protein